MDFAFLKQRYDFELDRKEKLTTAVAWPVGTLTALGGLMVAMSRTFTWESEWNSVFFAACLFLHASAFMVALVHFAGAYHGQQYEYLPRLGELDTGEAEIRDFYLGGGGTEAEAADEFMSQLRNRIIKAADRNARSNDRRTAFMHRANVALFCVLVFTANAGLSYVVDQARKNFMPTQPPAPPKPSTQATPQRTPPQIPQNRVIREGEMPKR